ncbi:uncharacterized protein LOC118738114 [Rhagoletis pomonella]|uniref:uncharacterized protein LOC118738114 n=1 Tax=Rhagoletis pomonella TaxID=28610 RepID=UPI00177BD832|nr:uncharacterized protein LOC118738114 [Rhagoletis pomonella]
MWLSHCIFCALLLGILYDTPASNATLLNTKTDTATPSTDPYLSSPPHERAAHTPRPAVQAANTASSDCLTNSLDSDSIYCRGSRAIRNAINNLNRMDKPLVLMRGLEIVPSARVGEAAPAESALESDDSFLGCVSEYLRNHELNIKFSDLLADESENYLVRQAERNGDGQADGVQEGRKKDKGQGIILAMALMFGKMMAVMGLGGIGAMALKALGVAMAALMMAALVGLKSLTQHGGESSHSVQYLSGGEGHHHMRRRSSNYDALGLAYRGWRKDQLKMQGV